MLTSSRVDTWALALIVLVLRLPGVQQPLLLQELLVLFWVCIAALFSIIEIQRHLVVLPCLEICLTTLETLHA
jgi:hypothetical protein